jgi:hypothetical protein
MFTLIKGNLRRGYKFSLILYAFTVFNIIVYAFLVEILKDTWSVSKSADFIRFLRYLLLVLAIAEFFLIKVLRKYMIRRGYPKEQNLKKITELLLSIDLITCALCESIVIYGLLLFFLSGDSINFYVFLVLGVIALGIYFPRFSRWEDLAKLQEGKNMSTT